MTLLVGECCTKLVELRQEIVALTGRRVSVKKRGPRVKGEVREEKSFYSDPPNVDDLTAKFKRNFCEVKSRPSALQTDKEQISNVIINIHKAEK